MNFHKFSFFFAKKKDVFLVRGILELFLNTQKERKRCTEMASCDSVVRPNPYRYDLQHVLWFLLFRHETKKKYSIHLYNFFFLVRVIFFFVLFLFRLHPPTFTVFVLCSSGDIEIYDVFHFKIFSFSLFLSIFFF